MGLSTSQDSADADHPLVLTSVVRNVSEQSVTDVTAALDSPDGWTATRLDSPPSGLAAGEKATVRWRLTPSAGATGTVGEARVRVGYREGGTAATASDATRLIAGDVVDPSTITATASIEQASNPGSNAADGDPTTFWLAPSSGNAPASLTLDLHQPRDLAGLTYLPRQDGEVGGWIADYTVSVSTDGQNFTPVAQGTWDFDGGLKSAAFQAHDVRYVRLTNSARTCLTPTSSQLTTAAEVGVIADPSTGAGTQPSAPAPTPADGLGQVVPHENMTATASSQQAGYPASNAIDASLCTIWHTQYSPYQPLPQSITLHLGTSYQTNGLAYLPRQDFDNGQITQYVISVSSDGQNFTDVAQGNWAQDATQKVATWPAVGARYVRLTAVAGNNGGSSSYPQGLASAGDLEVGYQ
ncbi:MAG: discoidin domain-containing protein [Actinobacteria bacterium]|nr:discoidin domain-containing protein [Actinomycetota bacterium]